MRSLLIRCYPARWRERYGDEFQAILEERPLGPFDVADILLGALDARLRHGRREVGPTTERRPSMSLRLGGIAAIVGAPAWMAGFVIGSGTFLGGDPRSAAILVLFGSVALLVALAALSAFQARVHPVLAWAAFALPAVGTIALVVGAAGVVVGRDELGDAFYLGLLAFYVGSLLFAIASFVTAVFSRVSAVLLGAATLLAIGAGGEEPNVILNVASLACFTLGWVALGAQAVRMDRPLSEPRPA